MKTPLAPKTRKGQATKQKMIKVAAHLMHKNGVNATTVNDVLEHSRTGKSQFSHYFGSKDSLIAEVIDFHVQTMVARPIEIINGMEGLEDLCKLVEFYLERQEEFLESFNGGCPIGQISLELQGSHTVLRHRIENAFKSVKDALAAKLLQLQAEGKLNAEIPTDEVSQFFLASMEGGCLLSKTSQSTAPLRVVMQHFCTYLRSFLVVPAS